MKHSVKIIKRDIIYNLTLNENFEIELISNDTDVLWPNRLCLNSVKNILIKYALTEDYEREKSNLLFQNYFKLPIQINTKRAVKALARTSATAFFCILIAVLPIPIISAVIVSHQILIILSVVLLALASVQIKEPIMSLKF
jgi:hypothetical protein